MTFEGKTVQTPMKWRTFKKTRLNQQKVNRNYAQLLRQYIKFCTITSRLYRISLFAEMLQVFLCLLRLDVVVFVLFFCIVRILFLVESSPGLIFFLCNSQYVTTTVIGSTFNNYNMQRDKLIWFLSGISTM